MLIHNMNRHMISYHYCEIGSEKDFGKIYPCRWFEPTTLSSGSICQVHCFLLHSSGVLAPRFSGSGTSRLPFQQSGALSTPLALTTASNNWYFEFWLFCPLLNWHFVIQLITYGCLFWYDSIDWFIGNWNSAYWLFCTRTLNFWLI